MVDTGSVGFPARPHTTERGAQRPAVYGLAQTGLDDDARSRPPVALVFGALTLLLISAIPTFVLAAPQLDIANINAAFQTQQIEWVQTTVLLAGALTTIPLGKLGDAYGKKRVLLGGCVCVLIGSVVCAVTGNFMVFLAGRALQGFATGTLLQTWGLVRDLVPRRWIPIAIGVVGGGFGLAAPLAALVGAAVVQEHSYTLLFWWMAAQVGLTIVMVVFCIPETPLRTPERPDWPGIGLAATGTFALTYGLNEASVPGRGWTSAWTIGFMAVGLILFAAFILYERRPDVDRTDTGLLRSAPLAWTLATTLFAGTILYGATTLSDTMAGTPSHLGTLATGYGLGFTGEDIGLYQLAAAVTGFGAAVGGAWYVRRHGARLPMIVSLTLEVLSFVLLVTVTLQPWIFEAVLLLQMTGTALILLAAPMLLVDCVPAHYQGLAGGILLTFLDLGTALSTQLVGLTLSHHALYTDPTTGASVAALSGVHLTAVLLATVGGILGIAAAFFLPHGRTPSIGGALPDATYGRVGATTAARARR